MWCKTGLTANKLNTRWVRNMASVVRGSYLHNPGSEPLSVETVGDVIAKTADKYPGRVAVKSIHENITLTYEELLKQADSMGCALRASGLEKGDRLGLWAHNSVAWIVALVAAARAGLISVRDKFTISEDGYGRIVGRLKDIIVRGGENIAPKEIEDVLNTHPDIVESQVVGVPDERLGEELCAVLRVREGASVTLDDVVSHCTGQIARFKIPRLVKTTEEFPKTVSGKIQKFKLKEFIESGQL